MIDLGTVSVGEEEMLAFARAYDPQPIHTDPEAAAASAFGGLIASGWLTAALFMRLFATQVLNRAHATVSPGLEELRWLRPVRPGDVLRGVTTILEVTPSERDASRGTVRHRGELVNQDGEVVLRLIARNHFYRRETAAD